MSDWQTEERHLGACHSILQKGHIICLHINLLFLLSSLDWWMVPTIYQTAQNREIKFFGICSYLIKYNLYNFPPSPCYFLIFSWLINSSMKITFGEGKVDSNISACKSILPIKVPLKTNWKEDRLLKHCIYSSFHPLVLLISFKTSLLQKVSK